MKPETEIFEIIADGIPYLVKSTSFVNGSEKLRFRVSVNNSPVLIFGWDERLDCFAIIKDARDPIINPAAERVIARKLETGFVKKQAA